MRLVVVLNYVNNAQLPKFSVYYNLRYDTDFVQIIYRL